MLSVLEGLPLLESISCNYYEVPQLPDRIVLPNIKEFKMIQFNKNVREPTANYKFARLVKKQMKMIKVRDIYLNLKFDLKKI